MDIFVLSTATTATACLSAILTVLISLVLLASAKYDLEHRRINARYTKFLLILSIPLTILHSLSYFFNFQIADRQLFAKLDLSQTLITALVFITTLILLFISSRMSPKDVEYAIVLLPTVLISDLIGYVLLALFSLLSADLISMIYSKVKHKENKYGFPAIVPIAMSYTAYTAWFIFNDVQNIMIDESVASVYNGLVSLTLFSAIIVLTIVAVLRYGYSVKSLSNNDIKAKVEKALNEDLFIAYEKVDNGLFTKWVKKHETIDYSEMPIGLLDPNALTVIDCLRILGLQQNFTKQELDTAFRNKAKQIHPDTTTDYADKATSDGATLDLIISSRAILKRYLNVAFK